jgi:hypothetical protein
LPGGRVEEQRDAAFQQHGPDPGAVQRIEQFHRLLPQTPVASCVGAMQELEIVVHVGRQHRQSLRLRELGIDHRRHEVVVRQRKSCLPVSLTDIGQA